MSNGNIQLFDWGQFEWVYEPENPNALNVMSIGIITILPGKLQKKHIHYGDEQFLYILSGIGRQLVGNTNSIIKKGDYFHIEAGSIHDTENIGKEPIKELVVSIPANYGNNLFKESDLSENKEKYDTLLKVNRDLQNIYDEFTTTLKIPISIFDKEGNILIKGKGYPVLCKMKCNINETENNCCLYRIQSEYSSSQHIEPLAFVCPHGLSVIIMPIICNGEVIGVIKGGHILNNENNVFQEYNISDVLSDSTQIFSKAGIKATLLQIKKMSNYIANNYIFNSAKIEINKKEKIIIDFSKQELALKESLKLAQEKVLNIQINNHFLFNTLNSIASLAVKENAFNTYDSVINLSKMFRYTLKTNSSLVGLKDEIEYLETYIDLQKLRYGGKLQVKFNISNEIENAKIPFNCLQPILENCFIHGFKNKKNKLYIEINGKNDKGSIIIEIYDNGIGMNKKEVEKLNKEIKLNYNEEMINGLMMINLKLQIYYKEKFSFEIFSSFNRGTNVKIVLPDKMV